MRTNDLDFKLTLSFLSQESFGEGSPSALHGGNETASPMPKYRLVALLEVIIGGEGSKSGTTFSAKSQHLLGMLLVLEICLKIRLVTR